MKILVIAPHPDDEVIGCGGAVCLHTDHRDTASAVFLTSGELGLKHLPREEACALREREAIRAAKVLGLTRTFFLRGPDWGVAEEVDGLALRLRGILKEMSPDLIYLPHPADSHPDHQSSLPVLRKALRGLPRKRLELHGYEVWSPLPDYAHVQDITAVMGRKQKALRAHASQLVEFDYLRAMTGLNQYRGALAGRCRFAEVFEQIAR